MGFRRNRYKEFPKLTFFFELLADFIIVICLGIVFVEYFLGRVTVTGNSMNPTLNNLDIVLVNHFSYKMKSIDRYDLIAFRMGDKANSKIYVKRVVGLPGETVKIQNGQLYINDILLEDDVIEEFIITGGLATNGVTLGEDEYFVLGDNRNNSEDSRFSNMGNVKIDNVVGKPWFIISPFNRFGNIHIDNSTDDIIETEES